MNKAPKRPVNADSARKGKAVEHLIAALSVLGSDGELNAWTALVDDEGVDLVFQLRKQPQILAVQVKSRFTTAKGLAERSKFQTQVRKATFQARRDLYMLFVVADPQKLDVGPLWLVPSNDFARLAKLDSRKRHKFAASAKKGSGDMWAPYLVAKEDLPERLAAAVAALA
jgi:hypothetical protein